MAINTTISLPGDKSISHRAVMLASIADGVSELTNLNDGKDVQSTIKALQACGALIENDDKKLIENADIIIGSRYIKGISVLHWPLSRLLLSIFANYYVKLVTGFKVNDSTGGFNGYNFKALNSILKNKIDFEGYAFQIQMKFIGYKIGYKIIEIPIIFKDREIGESKMSFKIFGEAFLGIMWMKFKSFFHGFKN